jgi:hypothetical protein
MHVYYFKLNFLIMSKGIISSASEKLFDIFYGDCNSIVQSSSPNKYALQKCIENNKIPVIDCSSIIGNVGKTTNGYVFSKCMEERKLGLYKFINDTNRHRGHTYTHGVNTDSVKFNPSGSCMPGGLYFTDGQNVLSFDRYGTKICKVQPLPYSKVYIDNCKFKADVLNVDLENCMSPKDFIKKLNKEQLLSLLENQNFFGHGQLVLDIVDVKIIDDEVCEKICSLRTFDFSTSNTELIEKLLTFLKKIENKTTLLNLLENQNLFLNGQLVLDILDVKIIDDEVCEKICSLRTFDFSTSNTELIEKLRTFVKKMDAVQIMKNAKKNAYFLTVLADDAITEELCTELIRIGYPLHKIISKEKIESFSNNFFELFSDKFPYYINVIPKKYLTHEMCRRAIRSGVHTSQIPEKFLTKELVELYEELVELHEAYREKASGPWVSY